MSSLTFLQRISKMGSRIAIQDKKGKYTYQQLFNNAMNISSEITNMTERNLSPNKRVLFLTDPDFNYISVQFAIWAMDGVSIPLSVSATPSEIEYFHSDSQADLVITQEKFIDRFSSISTTANILVLKDSTYKTNSINFAINKPEEDAMIVYTSGTTGKPKGVVHTHQSLQQQMEILSEAWQWSPDDKILNVLPLHHIHGIVNVLNCSLWNSARCELWEKPNSLELWKAFLRDDQDDDKLTIFMAVPTIYYNLIKCYDNNEITNITKEEIKKRLQRLRLMISGSAALPDSVKEKWEQISGQNLLERFGMTEIGMGISNPLKGQRITVYNFFYYVQGHVGFPLPRVQAAILDSETNSIYTNKINQEGELLIKSPGLFNRYLNKPQETMESFTQNGWFKTGDYASLSDNGMFKILGRISQDIIKKSGYKISSLEIENRILQHSDVSEVVVLGIPDKKYGEEIAALIVLKNKSSQIDSIQEYCLKHLSSYKIPRKWKILKEIPRNALGKVQKKTLKIMFEQK